jgi:AraC-like DNA-binding protein
VCEYLLGFFQPEEMAKFSGKISFALTHMPVFASHKILDVIGDITRFSVPSQVTNHYTAIKMQELFILQLARIFSEPEPKLKLSTTQLETLEQVRQLMLEDITKHYTLEELSRKTHINLHTLKNGFRQVYGLAPYEYRTEVRMQRAKELLQQTDKPIKEIAALVSYARFPSFVSAFSNYFGYTPGSVRK